MSQTEHPETLSAYFDDVGRFQRIEVEEEQRLARRYRAGDLQAGHALVTANLRFVVKIAGEYRSYGLRMADLIQEGNLGLLRAVQKFDPDQEVRLISYAVFWIRAYVQNYILTNWSLVKIGTTQAQRKLFFGLAKARRELEKLAVPGGELPSVEALAERLHVRPSDVSQMQQRLGGHDLSIDAAVTAEDDAETFVNLLASGEESQHDSVEKTQLSGKIAAAVHVALGCLDARERFIIENRHMGEEGMTLNRIGEIFGFSRERARQLELRAFAKLKAALTPVQTEVSAEDMFEGASL